MARFILIISSTYKYLYVLLLFVIIQNVYLLIILIFDIDDSNQSGQIFFFRDAEKFTIPK